MLDQSAEVAENQKLDKLLNILANQSSDDDSDESSNLDIDYDPQALSQDEDDLINDHDTNGTCVIPPKPTAIQLQHDDFTSITSLSNLMQYLSFEEFDLITECEDNDLKELMVLNRAKHIQIKGLIAKYESLLTECQSSLKYHFQVKQNRNFKSPLAIHRLGFPYFRMNDFGPLCNSDFHKKKKYINMDFTYSNYRMKWSLPRLKKLKTCVIFNYYSNYIKQNDTSNQSADSEENQSTKLLLEKMREDIAAVKASEKSCSSSSMECPPLWDDKYLSWVDIADNTFKDVAQDNCLRAMWNYYVHPQISHAPFTNIEDAKIMEFVKENPSPDWVQLAKDLNTNRSEHQLCTHYQSVLIADNSETSSEYSDDDFYNTFNMPLTGSTRSATRIQRRSYYLNATKNCRLGSFTFEEDLKIMALIKLYGTDFEKISEHMPHRSKYQIKYRYEASLSKDDLNYGNWKVQEDEQIFKYVNVNGEQNWPKLARTMKRNSAQIRHRYHRLKKILEDHPEYDIKTIPRVVRENPYSQIRKRKKRLQQIHKKDYNDLEIDQIMNMRTRMTNKFDEDLVNFFAPTTQLKRTKRKPQFSENDFRDCANSVKNILCLFDTTLHIPKCLSKIKELDSVDGEVLQILKASNTSNANIVTVNFQSNGTVLIPPNVSSIQSLRYLLMQSLNCNRIDSKNLRVLMQRHDVQLFVNRFKSFFMWPALMSTINPPYEIRCERSNLDTEPQGATAVKRKVGRPKKDKSKVTRMQEARKTAHDKLKASKTNESIEKVPNEETPIKFTFENGELKPTPTPVAVPTENAKYIQPCNTENTAINRENLPMTSTASIANNDVVACTFESKNETPTAKMLLKVVDKPLIAKLREQNRIKRLPPPKLLKLSGGSKPTSSTSNGANTPINTVTVESSVTITYERKRKVSDITQENNKKQKNQIT